MFDPNRAGYAPVHDEDPLIADAWERLARHEFDLVLADEARPPQERRRVLGSMRRSVLERLAGRRDADLKAFVRRIEAAIDELEPAADPVGRGIRALRDFLAGPGPTRDSRQS